MGTTWRNTTVKNRLNLRCGALLPAGIVFLAAAMAAPGQSQTISPSATGSNGAGAGAFPSSGSGSNGKSATQGQGLGPAVLPKDFAQLRIEPGDLLSVNIYDTPEFTDVYRVDPSGNLTLPLCGKVKVEGLTATEVARLLESTLKDAQVLNHPQVNVDVQQYAGQYVTVLGEVASPGRVTAIGPTKLSEILAQVGGLTPIAGTRIRIRHGEDDSGPELEAHYSRSETNQQTGSILVRPGDTVVVPRAGIIYVLGAVFHPGGYVMQEDGKLNVAEALALSGGTVLQAKTEGLRVIRRNPDGTVLDFSLSYDGIAKGTQTPLELQAQDIVYVPMSKLKAALSDATGIISAATSAAIYTAR
jgi:polysaccharide export outer membrane protein